MAAATGREGRLAWTDASSKPRMSFWHICCHPSENNRGLVAACIACHREEAIAEARVLQTALSIRCQCRVALGASSPLTATRTVANLLRFSGGGASEPSLFVAPAEEAASLVILLTKSTLQSPECLFAAARAINAGTPVVLVLLQGRGYSFPDAQLLLSDLRAHLPPAALESFEGYLDAAGLPLSREDAPLSANGASRVEDVQAQLLDTIPNVIAINWAPEGGANRLAATVEDIFRRLPDLTAAAKQRSRSSSSLSRTARRISYSLRQLSQGSDVRLPVCGAPEQDRGHADASEAAGCSSSALPPPAELPPPRGALSRSGDGTRSMIRV